MWASNYVSLVRYDETCSIPLVFSCEGAARSQKLAANAKPPDVYKKVEGLIQNLRECHEPIGKHADRVRASQWMNEENISAF
jgi:hypothetical protein